MIPGFLTVWSMSLLAFENFAKFVSRNSASQFVEITPSAKCTNVIKMLKSTILIAAINDQILANAVCNLSVKKRVKKGVIVILKKLNIP